MTNKIDYRMLCEYLATVQLRELSREELEDYAYGYIRDGLDDLSENELEAMAEEYGIDLVEVQIEE